MSWRREERDILLYEKQTEGTFEISEDTRLVANHPIVEAVQPHLFVWEPGATSIQNALWVAQIHYLSPMIVRDMFRRSYLLETQLLQQVEGSSGFVLDDQIITQLNANEGIFTDRQEKIKIFEVWGKYEVGGKLQEVKCLIEPSTYAMPTAMINPIFRQHESELTVLPTAERRSAFERIRASLNR